VSAAIKRRKFITLLGGAAAAWPLAARAQQAERVRRIGLLMGTADDREGQARVTVLKQGLQELGWADGRNIQIETRFGGADTGRIRAHAAELVARDPVGNGFVASLARPGGNTTGLAGSSDDSSPKQLELLATLVPNVSRIGLLGNPNSPTYFSVLKNTQAAAQKVGLFVIPIKARNPIETENAFAELGKERVDAVMVASDAVFFGQRQRMAELALRNRIPTMFSLREYAEAGGLMSYGEDLADFFYRAAFYVDKIFKGARPDDLPIEQPTRFNLVINRKTADALGVTIPPQLYMFADEVIE
jgi:putative ABC transport system substrate-binding protein